MLVDNILSGCYGLITCGRNEIRLISVSIIHPAVTRARGSEKSSTGHQGDNRSSADDASNTRQGSGGADHNSAVFRGTMGIEQQGGCEVLDA